MPFTTGDNNFGTAKWIVNPTAGLGSHTTIATALTSASSGDTIFIMPATYTENLTLKAGVNLAAYDCDALNGNVTIIGNATLSAAGTVDISGIRLQTTSAALLTVSGSAASIVNLKNCYLNCTNNTGITFSAANTAALINLYDCQGDLGTTGIGIYTMSSTGILTMYNCEFTNTGVSVTATSNSAGTASFVWCLFRNVFSTSSTGTFQAYWTYIAGGNTTALTTAGTGTTNALYQCTISGGSASAVSIGSGTTCGILGGTISSSNTNAISGVGTLSYAGIIFDGTSYKINTTTQTGGVIQGGQTQAPSAGFIGEVISSTATSIATSTSTAKSIASINITAGVWNVSAMSFAAPTGGTGLMTTHATGIGTTNNTLTGTGGIDFTQSNVADTTKSNCVGPIRVTLTATTTYYVVVLNTYSSTTCPTNATITATRAG